MKTGPRTTDAVQASRYWPTDAGWAAAQQAQDAIAAGTLEPLSEAS